VQGRVGGLWEFSSYPYIEGGHVCIKIRVPGDPTSIITADALLLYPEEKRCVCAEAGKGTSISTPSIIERASRLTECPAYLKEGSEE